MSALARWISHLLGITSSLETRVKRLEDERDEKRQHFRTEGD